MQGQLAAAQHQLSTILISIQQQPSNGALYKRETEARENVHLWNQRLESLYIQKSKEEWLNLDDTNGRYFHDRLRQRHHHNRIASYQLDNGQWTREYEKVVAHFVSYYEGLLGTPTATFKSIDDHIIDMGPRLSTSHQVGLV